MISIERGVSAKSRQVKKQYFAGSLWGNPALCVASYFQLGPISAKNHLNCFPEIEKILIKIAGTFKS